MQKEDVVLLEIPNLTIESYNKLKELIKSEFPKAVFYKMFEEDY